MNSLPEQLSAVRTAQLEAQFDFFRRLTAQAFDSTSKVIALNISASRESVERTSKAVRELFAVHDARDFFQLGSHAQEQLHSMFAYGRELISIASGAQAYAVRAPEAAAAALPKPVPVQAPPQPEQKAAPEPAPAVQPPAPEPQQAQAQPDQVTAYIQEHIQPEQPVVAEPIEPVVEPAPVAKPKPVARAAGKGVAKAAVVPHPVAAPIKAEEAAPKIEPTGPKRKK